MDFDGSEYNEWSKQVYNNRQMFHNVDATKRNNWNKNWKNVDIWTSFILEYISYDGWDWEETKQHKAKINN